jgi:hypothetical protein
LEGGPRAARELDLAPVEPVHADEARDDDFIVVGEERGIGHGDDARVGPRGGRDGRARLGEERLVLVDAHLPVGELEHEGARVVDLERDKAGHAAPARDGRVLERRAETRRARDLGDEVEELAGG